MEEALPALAGEAAVRAQVRRPHAPSYRTKEPDLTRKVVHRWQQDQLRVVLTLCPASRCETRLGALLTRFSRLSAAASSGQLRRHIRMGDTVALCNQTSHLALLKKLARSFL